MTMTATVPAPRPEPELTPEEYREAKARLIARHAWRHGLTAADLAALPYSSRHRADRTLTRFARDAYRASADPADHDRLPPHSYQSKTWRVVADKLDAMAAREAAGEPVPARDLTHDRHLWTVGTSLDSEVPTPTTVGTSPELEVPTPAHAVDAPKGWAELATLPPLDHGACIHHPDRRPVVVTLDGGRCADCPPRRREIPVHFTPDADQAKAGLVEWKSTRDGWGIALNWTPRPCPGGRCYCGRGPHPPQETLPHA